MTALLPAVVLVPLATAPLPSWLRRAGLDPARPALVAALVSLGLALALLAEVLAGAAPQIDWPWVPALGLGFVLKADALAAGIAVAVAAAAARAVAAERAARRGDSASYYGRALALTAATQGAVLAGDLALVWLCLELAALAAVLLVAGDGGEPAARGRAVAAFAVTEAGGLALLAGALLLADVLGGFRIADAGAATVLRADPLYPLIAGLVLAAAATRPAPWRAAADGRRAGLAAVSGAALAALVPLRLAPALGGTRSWRFGVLALALAWLLVAAARAAGAPRAAAARAAPTWPEDLALAAELLWRPLAAPRLALSLATVLVAAALVLVLAPGTVRSDAWPALSSRAWPLAAGSAWLLLAVLACLARRLGTRAARVLAAGAVAALLLFAAAAPPAVSLATVVIGLLTLAPLGRALALPAAPRGALLALVLAVAVAAAAGRGLLAPAGADARSAQDGAGDGVLLAPLLLPLAAAAALRVLRRRAPGAARALEGAALAGNLALAGWLLRCADRGVPLAFVLGAGPAPFGVHLLLDRLAAGMLLIAAAVAALAYGHGLGRAAGERPPGASGLFVLAGIAATVLAADLLEFCLGVAALVAAYDGLLAADDQARSDRSHAAVVAAVGSALLVTAAGCVYASLGASAYGELAVKVPAVASGAAPLLGIGASLLLLGCALRSAALPFGWWLLRAHEAAPAAPAAFAVVLLEVGVYALLRLYALVFPCFGAGPCGPSGLVLPLGLATLTGAGVGALAAARPRALAAQLAAAAAGLLLIGVGTFREAGVAAALYAFAPAALAGAALALAAGGAVGAAALAASLGLPPFAGAVSRIAILGAAGADALVVWSLALVAALFLAVAAARAALRDRTDASPPRRPSAPAACCALALCVALAVGAGPAYGYAARAARQLFDRQAYVAALAGGDGGARR